MAKGTLEISSKDPNSMTCVNYGTIGNMNVVRTEPEVFVEGRIWFLTLSGRRLRFLHACVEPTT